MSKRITKVPALLVLTALPLFAKSADETADALAELALPLTLAGAIIALLFAFGFFKWMMGQEEGTPKMIEIANHIREGASAYLSQQYRVVMIFFALAFVVFALLSFVLKIQNPFVPFAFLTGGVFSALAGFFGMKTATQAAVRTTHATKNSLNRGLKLAFRSGSVMGLTVVGLVLLGISMWYLLLDAWIDGNWFNGTFLGVDLIQGEVTEHNKYHFITTAVLSFGVGASFMALFARVGGGIFTKAADVGADLVGKIEKDIPEDDPRNPATIADNVGDNVGDVAGLGADLYESYAGSILAASALGVSAGFGLRGIALPIFLSAFGVLASIIGIFAVKTKEDAKMGELLNSLRVGVYGASVLIMIAAFFLVRAMLPNQMGIFGAIITGLIAGNVIGFLSEYYTASEFKPTQDLAASTKTGPATLIIGGVGIGMKSTFFPVLTIGIAIMAAFGLAGGFGTESFSFSRGLYGIGIAAVGMLSTLGITLATDAYGPISDNAGGIAEMAGMGEDVRKKTDSLDALGNTTAAIGKGFAIGSAALTAMALIAAYVEEVKFAISRVAALQDPVDGIYKVTVGVREITASSTEELVNFINKLGITEIMDYYYQIHLMNPKVIVGLFIGATLAFFFCALTIEAVGRAAAGVVEEVRRQFNEIPGLLEGKEGVKADYAKAVRICTKSAQTQMVAPALLAIITPAAVGLVLGIPGVIGLLMGGLTSGFALAIMMANSGGAWDNAKKYIEDGHHGGKGSDNHKAAVVGDTVGDPFKDTAGPGLDILIKLMSMVSVVFAGAIVAFAPKIQEAIGIADKVIK